MSVHLALDLLFNRPWAIARETLDTMARVTMERRLTDSEILEKLSALELRAAAPVLSHKGGVAVIPVYGALSQRPTIFTLFFGGSTTQSLSLALREAVSNPNVGTVIFDIDSPGGSTAGIPELAAEILQARGRKRVIAVSNSLMASAAYWLGSQADEVVVSPSSMTGSIGVYTIHVDESRLNEKIGLVPTYVFSGKYKVEANPDGPLSATARQYLQLQVDDFYRMFVGAVAKGRGVSTAEVINGFGEGRMMTPTRAVAAGLADRVATLSQVLAGAGIASTNPRLAAELKELQRLSRGPQRTSSITKRTNFQRWAELEKRKLALMKAS